MPQTNRSISRRDALALTAGCITALPAMGCTGHAYGSTDEGDELKTSDTTNNTLDTESGGKMQIHYLEVVTKDVDAAIKIYSGVHGVKFGEADPSLGNARTAKLKDGGMMGIRAPMHDGEKPVTRAYVLVDDIEAAVAAAEKAGAEIAVPPMKIPGHGTCAVYFHGAIEAGFWQV